MGYDIILLQSVLVLSYTHGIGSDGASGLCGKVLTDMDKVTSFTPPPWDITKGAYGALHVGPARLDHPGKARVEYAADRGHDLLAQRDADARLIHAAHDMLATLKALVIADNKARELSDYRAHDDFGWLRAAASVARATIARVEGGAA